MQDSLTGNMVPLDARAMDEAIIKELAGKVQAAEIKLQAAKDAALPDRNRQGPVFRVGEVLEIRGGKFRVRKLTRQGIVLKRHSVLTVFIGHDPGANSESFAETSLAAPTPNLIGWQIDS